MEFLVNKEEEIKIGNLIVGENPIIIGGPCTVNTKEDLIKTAIKLKEIGVNVLRGGIYKPRTNPYSFQGLGKVGLEYLKEVKRITGLPIITEILSIDEYDEEIDIIQIGSRNMANYDLLKKLGKIDKPILLKRGMASTYDEWIMAAEYIKKSGNHKVILCERGIRTFEPHTRNTLDIQAIPYIKQHTKLKIFVDPSHACGNRYMIESISKASLAAGCDGLIIECEINPDNAICDKEQTIDIETMKRIIDYGERI